METLLLKTDAEHIDGAAVEKTARIIRSGGLAAFPTETVYGLGADATDKNAAKKIYEAKGRPSDNPLIIHISEPQDAEKYAYTSPLYYKLAKAFMPGPLTVIMPKKDIIPKEVTGGLDSVAVRCPSHPVARELIRLSGTAIAAPSANTSGSPSPTTASHVIHDLNGRIDAVLDGGPAEIGLESTIVRLLGEDSLVLLRPGAVTVDALSCVCGDVSISHAVTEALKENERPLSPGMKYRHYAPKAPLILLDGTPEDTERFLINASYEENCTVICYHEEADRMKSGSAIDIGCREDISEQAKNLFSALRVADEMNSTVIYAHLPPKNGIGLALYNRMIRAAAHTVKKI